MDTRDMGKDPVKIDLWYPRQFSNNPQELRISLIDVRAANDIVIHYDFDRDGWVIQSNLWDPDIGHTVDQDFDTLHEVAFIPAWPTKESMAEVKVENRITYHYGINGDQTRTGFASFQELQQRVESETSGLVQVTKKESRFVTYDDWIEDV